MSISNENCRPSICSVIGPVSASKEVVVFKAHKKVLLKKVELLDSAAVSASESVYVSAQLKKNGSNLGSAVDTKAGVAARVALLLGSDVALVANDVLTLALTVASTGALTQASVCVDEHILGS